MKSVLIFPKNGSLFSVSDLQTSLLLPSQVFSSIPINTHLFSVYYIINIQKSKALLIFNLKILQFFILYIFFLYTYKLDCVHVHYISYIDIDIKHCSLQHKIISLSPSLTQVSSSISFPFLFCFTYIYIYICNVCMYGYFCACIVRLSEHILSLGGLGFCDFSVYLNLTQGFD